MPKVYARSSRKRKAAAKREMINNWNTIMMEMYGSNSDIPAMSVYDLRAREQKEQEAQLAELTAQTAKTTEGAKAFDDIAAALLEISSIQTKRAKLLSKIVLNPATQMKIGTQKMLLDVVNMASRIIAKIK